MSDATHFLIVCSGGHWEELDGEHKYVRPILSNHGIYFPCDGGHTCLVEIVKAKIDYPDKSVMKLFFQHPDMGYVMHIKDDSDITHLKSVICTVKKVVHLYVEDAMVNYKDVEQRSKRGKVVGGRPWVGECSGRKRTKISGGEPSGGVDIKPKHERRGGGGDEVDEVVSLSDVEVGNNLMDYGQPLNFCKRRTSPVVSSESEEGDSEEEVWADDEHISETPFPGMPRIPSDPVVMDAPKVCKSGGATTSVKPLMIFQNKDDLVVAVGLKCIEEGHEMVVRSSSTTRYEAVCSNQDDCSWRLYASVIKGAHGAFQVRKFNDKHTCSTTQVHPNHKQGNRKVLGHLINRMMGDDLGRVYRGNDIINDLTSRYGISVSYKQAWAAKQNAFKIRTGSGEESFSKLPIYLHNLKKHNPGTVSNIRTDAENRFEMLFMALGCTVISLHMKIYCNFFKHLKRVDLLKLII